MDAIQFNHAAVLTAALVSFVIGGVWYSPLLFAKTWMRAAGLDEAELKGGKPALVFGLSFVCSVVIAYNLAAFIGPKGSLGFGALAGFAAGLGWVAMSLAVIYLFERRRFALWAINAGYQVTIYTIMGALIGAWR